MATIITYRSPTQVKVTGPEVLRWRYENRKWIEGSEFSPAYSQKVDPSKPLTAPGNRRFDGYYYPGDRYLANTQTLYCAAGLVERLKAELGAEVLGEPVPPGVPRFSGLLDKDKLRDYQLQVLGKMTHQRWGRVAAATNAGKGAIIALFAKAALAGGLRTLILCDEISVFQALEEEIYRWAGWAPGVVSAGTEQIPDGQLVLAMVPTLAKRLSLITKDWTNSRSVDEVTHRKAVIAAWSKWCSEFPVLLLDEADKSTAMTWQRIIAACDQTHWRVGFSGTFPESGSLLDVQQEEYLGPVLHRIGNEELIERGISAKPSVVMHTFRHHFPRTRRPSGWGNMLPTAKRLWIYDEAITYNTSRHEYIARLLHPDAMNVIVVRRLEHGESLSQHLTQFLGKPVPFLQGSSKVTERKLILGQFEEGIVTTLVVTSILDRGTNKLGWAQNVVFASGEGSDRQTLQRVGRGLRRNGGKEYVEIQDILDSGQEMLDRAVRKRILLYNQENFEISIVKNAA